MKLKVWQVIWGLKDGGAENLAREYAQYVDKEKFESTIVTMYPFENTANYQRAMGAGLRVISVFKRRNAVTRGVRVLFGKWYVPFVLKKLLAKEKPDVIHFNSTMAVEFLPAAKVLHGKRLVYTCHSEVGKYFSDKEKKAVQKLLEEHSLRLIGLHEDMRAELNKQFDVDDAIVIKNGVDIDSYRGIARSNAEVRKSISIPKDAFVVGHIGRFSKTKNHEFLLQVFQEVAKQKDDAYLLLIGNGELETEIRKQIGDLKLDARVIVLSHRTDIPELLSAMDVMVFPSFFEGLSVVLVEAQAAGLRCVVSDSVNRENFLLDTTIPMSLKFDAKAWADVTLDHKRRNADHGNIEDYDIKREIRRLERVYCGYDPE